MLQEKIEYASLHIKKVLDYKKYKTSEFEKSIHFINLHKQAIIDAYFNEEKNILQQIEEIEKEWKFKEDLVSKKKCICGKELRWIESHKFWSCVDYLNYSVEHFTFGGFNHKPKPTIQFNWVALLIKKIGFKGKIQAKTLLNWFEENGYQDLVLKYKTRKFRYNYDNYKEAQQRSILQENIAAEYLRGKYKNVVYQQQIDYKLFESKLETHCVPDFICSNEDGGVCIYDCKLDFCDDEKMQMYVDLLSWILKSKGDNREVSFCYIMYPPLPVKEYKFPIIEIPRPKEEDELEAERERKFKENKNL